METYVKFFILGGLAFLVSVLAQKGWFPFHNRKEMARELIDELAFVVFISASSAAFVIMVCSWLNELF